MRPLDFGDVTVDRLVEFEGEFFEPDFFPDYSAEAVEAQSDWLRPQFVGQAGELLGSVHSYVVRTRHHIVLVDTCFGNCKSRTNPRWNDMRTPWLAGLRALGVEPEQVDVVMCTHLHPDHVGWNTRLRDGRWVPTFPNARYLFEATDYEAFKRLRAHPGLDGSFDDSIMPVVEAGQAQLVAGDFAIDDTLWLEPLPGHSPGHMGLNLAARGGKALFVGDALHHPVQIAHPEWNSAVCWNPDQSRATRRRVIERLADTATVLLPAHFSTPTAGRVVSNGARWRWVGL